jgi:hypothetical protein
MSVTQTASTAPPPAPSNAPTPASSSQDTSKPQPNEVKANQTGDEHAAAQQAERAPLPPGQGTRVDMLV